MKYKALLILLIISTACREVTTEDSFNLADPTPRFEWNGVATIKLSENKHQESFCRDKAEFGVLTDNLSDYFFVDLSKMPESVGEKISGTADWTTKDSMYSRKKITFEVRKIEGDTYWLASDAIRFVARKLE